VEIKGKGVMRTWFLLGRPAAQAIPAGRGDTAPELTTPTWGNPPP
jgi:hypothetical protein